VTVLCFALNDMFFQNILEKAMELFQSYFRQAFLDKSVAVACRILCLDVVVTSRPAHSAAMPLLFYSVVQKWVFRPAEATRCPDKREIWQRSSPVPNFTFIEAKMCEYSPHNCQNFKFWPKICTSGATRLQYFYKILSVCTFL